MKKTLLYTVGAASLMIAMSAVAADKGFYLEPNLGYGKVNETVIGSKNDNTGLIINGNAGYQLNQNFAVEGGYTHFATEDFGYGVKGKGNYAFDLAAKGILPIQNGVSAFGKVGIAAVHHTVSIAIPGIPTQSQSWTKPAALLAAGVSYDVNDSVGVQTQFTATTKNGEVPAMYGVTAGLKFNIG